MASPAQSTGESTARAPAGRGKSATAFRTISEVAGELDVAQHVLRFWESKFPQVRPLKRGGGRRYYRPEDVELLRQIRSLLYDEGYTIKGAQKLLRAQRRPGGGEVAAGNGGNQHGPALRARQGTHSAADPELELEDEVAEHALPAGDALPGTARARLAELRDELVRLRDTLRRALG